MWSERYFNNLLLFTKFQEPEERIFLKTSLNTGSDSIPTNPNVNKLEPSVSDNSENGFSRASKSESDTIKIINFCIEEIIDAVQENSAVIVAVNEAISAVDEEVQKESAICCDNFSGENVKNADENLNLKETYSKVVSTDHSLQNNTNNLCNRGKNQEEHPKECSVNDVSSCKTNKDQGINEINTNGKGIPKDEIIISSKETKDFENKKLRPNITNNQPETNQNKNRKMKKLKKNTGGGSKFRLGSLFGIGNSSNNSDFTHKDPIVASNPRYSSLELCESSYNTLEVEKQRNQPFSNSPKYHKSTTSLVKRSASKLSLGGVGGGNAYSCSQARSQHVRNQHNSSYQTLLVPDGSDPSIDSTPVLLAVRKRASSDSKPGLSSYGSLSYFNNGSSNDDSNYYSSNSSKDCSPSVHPKNKNSIFTNRKHSETKQQTSSSSKLGFLKLFNKSLHALNPTTHGSHLENEREKPVPISSKSNYTHKGGYSTLQHQKRIGRIHQVNGITSNSPTIRRIRTLPPEAVSDEKPFYQSDLTQTESITTLNPVPRPVLPLCKRISSNTSATFNAREHLMFMLKRRRRGGKFSPNTDNDYEDINVGKLTDDLGISSIRAINSEPTSSSMSSINSTNDRRRGNKHQSGLVNHRYQHSSNVPTSQNVHQLTVRPQVHHHNRSHAPNNRHLPVHSSSSTNSVNSTTSSREGNTGKVVQN